MPRQIRNKGEFSSYHIIQRGNERKNIFFSDDDRLRFLDTLEKMKTKYNFLLYSYCLMDNHVHLIINDNGNDISLVIKSINISYAYYFNRKYMRCGHLFQDRFKSQLIDNDGYLLEVSRYIHNNPAKASMVKAPADYKWSSYNIITGREHDLRELVDRDKLLGIISSNHTNAAKEYIEYVTREEQSDIDIMDIEEYPDENENTNFIYTIEQAQKMLAKELEAKGILFDDMLKQANLRNELIKSMRKNSSLTLKQLGQLFGEISESRISRILSSN